MRGAQRPRTHRIFNRGRLHRVRVCACVRACVRACVCVCVLDDSYYSVFEQVPVVSAQRI